MSILYVSSRLTLISSVRISPFSPYHTYLLHAHLNSPSFYFYFLAVCVTGDLQAYAVRNVTTTAGLNSTGVVVGSGTGQSLQVSNSI